MRSPSKGRVAKKLMRLRAGLRHAFAVRPEAQPFSIEDIKLMDRVADAIVKRGMAAPATVFLESMGPMNFLGSQALHFLTPIIECVFTVGEVEQIARLLERRDLISRLVAIIETKSSAKWASAR